LALQQHDLVVATDVVPVDGVSRMVGDHHDGCALTQLVLPLGDVVLMELCQRTI
jgi:hypothetical protein